MITPSQLVCRHRLTPPVSERLVGQHNVLAQVNIEDELLGNHSLRPFTPGSRVRVVNADTVLEGAHWHEGAPGREEWLVIGLDQLAPPARENATRRQPVEAKPVKPETAPTSDFEHRLKILEYLKQRGLVTDQEYQEKCRAILKDL